MPAVAAWARGANEAKVVAATTSAAAAAVVAVLRFVRGWAWAVMMGGVILCWKSRREGWTEINGKGTMTGVPRLMGLDRKLGKKESGCKERESNVWRRSRNTPGPCDGSRRGGYVR